MENISIFDIISLSLIFILGIKGVINGFIKEVFGLVGIVGGIFIASRFAKEMGLLVNKYLYQLDNDASLFIIGFICVLLGFWILSIFAGYLLEKLIKMSGFGGMDKLAGFIVGSAKIFLVFSILAVTLSNIEFIKTQADNYMQKSFMYPIFVQTGRYIVKIDSDKLIQKIDSNKSVPKIEITSKPLNSK
ncbi:CvpA family protein [Sulfurospirillum arcachonense]|uniref:CvpA family protein n=1 Tax=Sulfurospirillum arcachonense TaxID=57666 RepID=UPI00046ABC7B|nr:CvpA family protein [Sulfurospirillum arcachonense]